MLCLPTHPQAFIKDRFDPALFYGVFNKGAPLWLDGIIHSHPGRQLLYELSSKHKNCLLLNFAIQKMLGKGYEDEVARVGSRCAHDRLPAQEHLLVHTIACTYYCLNILLLVHTIACGPSWSAFLAATLGPKNGIVCTRTQSVGLLWRLPSPACASSARPQHAVWHRHCGP